MDHPPLDDWDAALAAIVDAGPLDDPWDEPDEDPAEQVRHLSDRPGPGLVRTLDGLNPRRLAGADAIAYARATERVIAWLHLLQAKSLVAVAGPRPQEQVHTVEDAVITIEDAARSEVAAALRWPDATADDRITTARLLCGPLMLTRSALTTGEITYRHAEAVAATVQRIASFRDWYADTGDDRPFATSCRALEEDVIPVARSRDVSATRRRAERVLQRLDAPHAEQRRRQARLSRDVWIEAEPDGMALLCARLGIAEAHACLSVIDGAARQVAETASPTSLTIGERRAEALTTLVLAGGSSPDMSTGRGSTRAHVDVVVSLSTLLGMDEEPGSLRGAGPGGPVPVSAEVVRELIDADQTATMRRLVADPLTGHLLDRGRSTYAIPSALRAYIAARDVTCRFPGCNRRADRGQVDHAISWEAGGRSDRDNLGILCIRHHQLKTFAGWRIVRSAAGGSATWRSPAGITYEHPPPRLLSDE